MLDSLLFIPSYCSPENIDTDTFFLTSHLLIEVQEESNNISTRHHLYFLSQKQMPQLIFLLALAIHLGVAQASSCPTRQSIAQSLQEANVPGAVIIVVNATHTLYEQAVGNQSLLPPKSMDIDRSIFPIASISKTFMAIAVMQLVERELVDLDADINQYLGEPYRRIYHPLYPSHAITLRRLMSHSASIAVPGNLLLAAFLPGDTAFVETLADSCFRYVNPNVSDNWLPKPPGTVSFYSNEGSAVVALVVERVAKMPYMQYVKEKILRPLGIGDNETGFRVSDFPSTDDFVKHYMYPFNATYVDFLKGLMPLNNFTQISVSVLI